MQDSKINKLITTIPMFWGAVVLLPVGMNYLGLALLTCGVVAGGRYSERYQRMRSSGIFLPVLAFVAWTLFALVIQQKIYAETPGNLFHGLRIALTLLLASSLSSDETNNAIKGMAIAFVCVLIWLAGYYTGLFPFTEFWAHFTHPSTNKSISASILFSFVATASIAIAFHQHKWARAGAILILAICVIVIIDVLGKRTAIAGIFIGTLAITLHQWRGNLIKFAGGILTLTIMTVGTYNFAPSLQNRIDQGVLEVQGALDGKVSLESWNVRIQMIRHTTDMMLEKPALGWGIGSWNTQWGQRSQEIMRDYNMPHNDFLWMGAQAGIPGALAWLAIFLAACWRGWQTRTVSGQVVFAIALMALFSSLVNNGTRDAGLGLPILFILGVTLALINSRKDSAPSVARQPTRA